MRVPMVQISCCLVWVLSSLAERDFFFPLEEVNEDENIYLETT